MRRTRTVSGLILFTFVFFHLSNHALGLVSINAMEAFQDLRTALTRSLPGTVILLWALIAHVSLALVKLATMRTWRVGAWEGVQLLFGLLIPFLLLRHLIGSRLPYELYDISSSYSDLLFVLWPGEVWTQLGLITLAWVHGCIGLHFWLRLKRWYARFFHVLYPVALFVPVLAFAGFAVAGREVRVDTVYVNPYSEEQYALIAWLMQASLWIWLGLIVFALAVRFVAHWLDSMRSRVRIEYVPGVRITTTAGATLLEISRQFGVPHASVCGGRARCSTCRVRVLEGLEQLDQAGESESRVLARIGAGTSVRLACQIRPRADLKVTPLVPVPEAAGSIVAYTDRYNWGVEQQITVMFADMRGFTTLSQHSLPFDVVFMLNQYLARMSDAIAANGGYVDKYMGDGVMALFGMESGAQAGARQSLSAAVAMGAALQLLNDDLASSLERRLEIGIGLFSGPAILGRIGQAGQGTNRSITALGDTVNTASRLEAAAKGFGAELVAAEETFKQAGIVWPAELRREVELRGRSGSVAAVVFERASLLDRLLHETGS